VIKPGVVTAEILRRFDRETQVLGRLQHPGIAQIYDAGTTDPATGGQPYFAMECVDGRPITAHAAAASLTTDARLALLAEVCDAVHHAHQRGVIHRDLKPANILVDTAGQTKVLDFGIARVTDADIQATMQTDVGQLLGTLPYMSPEQVAGDVLDVDTRSDVYTLGVVLYQLLADRLPYEATGRALTEMARVIAEEEPASLRTLDRTLDGDVELIVRKALEKERTRRYQSAAELAIRRIVLGDDHPDAMSSVNNLAFVLTQLGDYIAAEPLYREALERWRESLGAHPRVAAALSNMAALLRNQGDDEAAEPLYREALAMRRTLMGEHPDVAANLTELGALLKDKGEYTAAEAHHREALAMLRRLYGEEHRQNQEAVMRLVELYEAWDRPEQAAEYRALLSESDPQPRP